MAINADLNGVIANVRNGVGHWKRMATRLARTLAEPQARSGTGRTERRAAATSGPKYRHDRTVTLDAAIAVNWYTEPEELLRYPQLFLNEVMSRGGPEEPGPVRPASEYPPELIAAAQDVDWYTKPEELLRYSLSSGLLMPYPRQCSPMRQATGRSPAVFADAPRHRS